MPHEPEPIELRDTSNQLLTAVDRLRALENQKREEPISSPRFHKLADEIAGEARKVFRVAEFEERQGDEMPTQDATIEDPAPFR